MNRRGDIVTGALLALAVLLLIGSVIVSLAKSFTAGVFICCVGMFLLLLAIYLEVYSHRE